MIRRLFYLGLGAYLGVWTMRRLQALRPDHVARRTADRALELASGARLFADEVRRLSAGRETELRARFALGSVDGVDGTRGARGVESIHHDDEKDGR
ncbi:hypothetical protein Sru01_58340 [Sphaerisporangium rufum]|uniref:Uncharacterized protein n=1 Tax=Sphaerisporangium rufum TaxID=1381558 RepID=A0A919R705_9ACTN|nr:hypothetical protein [Sphaerisporangium rufum]GII80852.1 hypothetical protein Sru01_58340 [Sphaerisporangium rufum]